MLARSKTAHAFDVKADMLATFAVLGLGAVGAPLAAFRDADAPVGFGLGVGTGGDLDAVAVPLEVEGALDRQARYGWTARSRTDIATYGTVDSILGSMRFDTIGSVRAAGDDTLALDALGGAAAWLSADDVDRDQEGEVHAAAGPQIGVRVRAVSPYVRARLEALYVPLFGEAPTGRLHHLDVGTRVAITPWPDPAGCVAFELALKREIGFGSGYRDTRTDDGVRAGTVATIGVGFTFDPSLLP